MGNPKLSRKESDVAVTLARPMHMSKDGQSKEKGKTKQATVISDFHAHGSKSSLWPICLAFNIDDVTIHPSRGSRINPTLKQDSTTGEFRFTVYTPSKKKKSKKCWESVLLLSRFWTRTNTGCVMRYCMVIHFLCSCE